MARFSAGGLTTAGSTTLPVVALVGSAGVRLGCARSVCSTPPPPQSR